jgi:drug/metabolite transporter (DMT)-like permease
MSSISGLRLHATAIAFTAIFTTGFIFADMGLTGTGPFTFLGYRFALASLVLVILGRVLRHAWGLDRRQVLHIVVSGLLLQAGYLGAVFFAISRGVPPGVSGIIAGLQPLIALFFYVALTGKWLSRLDLLGALLGFAGVLLIISQKLTGHLELSGAILANVLAAVAYALGAVYTSKYVRSPSKVNEMTIQFIAATIPCLVLAWWLEGFAFNPTPLVIFALSWSTLVLSVFAIFLMLVLIHQGGAKYFSFWNFLMPAFAALYAWLVRGEQFTSLTYGGIALVLTGLLVVNSQRFFAAEAKARKTAGSGA